MFKKQVLLPYGKNINESIKYACERLEVFDDEKQVWAFLSNNPPSVPNTQTSKKRPTLELASASDYKPLKKRKEVHSDLSQKITKHPSTNLVSTKNPFNNTEPSDLASNFSLSMLSLNSTIKPT